jgi:hypothetical protein
MRAASLIRVATVSALLASICGAQAPANRGGGFTEIRLSQIKGSEIYPNLDRPTKYTLNATVLFARGTPWSRARALRQIRKTSEIFRACEIGLGRIHIGRLDLPKELLTVNVENVDTDTGVPRNVRILSELLHPDIDYPVAFLIGRVDGDQSLARSYRTDDVVEGRIPYLNTAWIGYKAHWIPRKDDLYSPLAHEFAHLLCRCGHERTDQRHLLHSARNFLSSRVLPEHCERMQQSPLVYLND